MIDYKNGVHAVNMVEEETRGKKVLFVEKKALNEFYSHRAEWVHRLTYCPDTHFSDQTRLDILIVSKLCVTVLALFVCLSQQMFIDCIEKQKNSRNRELFGLFSYQDQSLVLIR
ncbi:hypothetical protein BpHYR1_052866 [Brachionus plicatilis]|uniref:Uncharacterized protein n=1 Tax=Brachionus plicatilis TaxID=10195 RepID=A0A3M7RJ01_BRAPC|nr:hypothetical protein BpHYR1_052866 [Brachionus plicatilis]